MASDRLSEQDNGALRACGTRMIEAASAFLDGIDPVQREKATFSWDDAAARTDWAYFPRSHPGLPLHEMDTRQQKRAHRLISYALSLPAYAKVCTIMALESVLDEMEGRRGSGVRDSGRYFVSVFGRPGDGPWAWRLEGHHVSLNMTLAGANVVSSTPLFLGANPADVRHGAASVVRPCGEEEDAARALLELLDEKQRSVAVISDDAPPDFVLTNMPLIPAKATPGEHLPDVPMVRRAMEPAWDAFSARSKARLAFARDKPLGLVASRMDPRQREALNDLIAVYLDRLPGDVAVGERARIDAGFDELHFAWAGSATRREGHYYRVQGPSLLVEYDNTQDGANHVHAVWRDPTRDFGIDALRRHVAAGH